MARLDLQLDLEVSSRPSRQAPKPNSPKALLHAGLSTNISSDFLSVPTLEIQITFSNKCTEAPCFMGEKDFQLQSSQ